MKTFFLTVVQAQLAVELDGPHWMVAGEPAIFQCTFENLRGDNDINAFHWRTSDFTVEDPRQTELLLAWDLQARDGSFSGPEDNRMTCLKLKDGVYRLNITEVSLDQDDRRYWCIPSTYSDGSGDDTMDSFVSGKCIILLLTTRCLTYLRAH